MQNYLLVFVGTSRNLWRFFAALKEGWKQENSCDKYLSVWWPGLQLHLRNGIFLRTNTSGCRCWARTAEQMYFPNQANHPDQFDQSHSAKSDTQKNRSTKVGKKIKYESVLNLQLIWKRNPLFFYRYFSGVDGRVERQLVESDCGSFGAVSEKHFQRLQKCRPRCKQYIFTLFCL